MLVINGKRKAFRGKSEAEVFRKIAAYKGEIEKGRAFEVVAEEWHDKLWPTLAHNTTSGYNAAYSRALDEFGETPIKGLTPAKIEAFIREFCSKGYAKKTAATQLQVIKQICNHAVLAGDIGFSPAQYVMLPNRLPQKRRELPSQDQIDKVKSSVNLPFGLFAYLILCTGLRRGEALALTFGDIDPNEGLIHVDKSLYWESNVPRIKAPKSRAGERDVILPDALKNILPKEKPGKLVFPGSSGGMMTYTNYRLAWDRYKKLSGVQISPHELRHAYATTLYDAGIDVKAAQELLGHSTVAMTQDIYTHISQQRREDTRRKLNAQINEEYIENTQ